MSKIIKTGLFFVLFIAGVGIGFSWAQEGPEVENIKIGEGTIRGTTPTMLFSRGITTNAFSLDSNGKLVSGANSTGGNIRLSGGTTTGGIDFGNGGDDDLQAADVIDLTDGGETTRHSHGALGALTTITLDIAYHNDGAGDAEITVDARDVSFDLNDSTNDYKVSIDNTTAGAIGTALLVRTTGTGATITTALDLSDAGIVSAIDIGANNFTGSNYSFVTTSNGGIFLTDAASDNNLIISSTDWVLGSSGITNMTTVKSDDGTASAPAFAYGSASDTDSGIYRAGANDLRMVAAGSGTDSPELRVFDTTGTASDGIYVHLQGTATTNGMCHNNTGTGTGELAVDCSGTPGDLAEWYETHTHVEPGDLVVMSNRWVAYQGARLDERNAVFPGEKHRASILEKSARPYQENLFGVISTAPYRVMGEDVRDAKGVKHPLPLALVGRVAVKVSAENGKIEIGDSITSSSVAGVGMKATKPGAIVGVALEPYRGEGIGKIMMLVDNEPYSIPQEKHEIIKNEIERTEEISTLLRDKKLERRLDYVSRHLRGLSNRSEEELKALLDKPFTITGDLSVRGDIIEILKTKDFGEQLTYAQVSLESYVKDRGEAQLSEGVITIPLSPEMLSNSEISQGQPMLVYVTPTSLDTRYPLAVETANDSFTVRETGGGRSNGSFVWEVSAKRKRD